MLLKFAYQDFLADRKFKNTTQVNIGNYERTLGLFIEYCLELGVINIEEVAQSASKIALDNAGKFVKMERFKVHMVLLKSPFF